jgi:hypothetical protein
MRSGACSGACSDADADADAALVLAGGETGEKEAPMAADIIPPAESALEPRRGAAEKRSGAVFAEMVREAEAWVHRKKQGALSAASAPAPPPAPAAAPAALVVNDGPCLYTACARMVRSRKHCFKHDSLASLLALRGDDQALREWKDSEYPIGTLAQLRCDSHAQVDLRRWLRVGWKADLERQLDTLRASGAYVDADRACAQRAEMDVERFALAARERLRMALLCGAGDSTDTTEAFDCRGGAEVMAAIRAEQKAARMQDTRRLNDRIGACSMP